MLDAVLSVIPADSIAVHFHDTHGQALANIFVSLQRGISAIDSSIAGLGGCPYAKGGAPGNVATEDVVCLLHGLGVQTGVDFSRLLAASEFISRELRHPPKSRAAMVLAQMVAGETDPHSGRQLYQHHQQHQQYQQQENHLHEQQQQQHSQPFHQNQHFPVPLYQEKQEHQCQHQHHAQLQQQWEQDGTIRRDVAGPKASSPMGSPRL